MAQLTNQWQTIGSVYVGNTGYGDVYLDLNAVLVSQDKTNNKSRIGTALVVRTTVGSWWSDASDTLDGNQQSLGSYNFSGDNWIHIIERDISHNSDGTGSGSASGSLWTYWFGTQNVSGSFTLPTIPRYASITSFSVAKRDETSVTFNWKANATIDYVWYSTNDGSSWTGYNTPDGTSGSFTVSGLSANTTYNFKLRVRRKDSQLNTTSSRVQQTTYDYPYVSAVGTSNLIIGNSQTLTLYNPLSRSCSVYMKKDNTSGTEFYNGTTSGTSITFTPDSTTMYESIPNNPSGNCVYYCTYSSHTVSTQSGTYTVDANECIPEFSDFEYSTDYSNLTGDNETIIKGETTTTFTISTDNKAIAKNSATISKYRVECGNISDEVDEASGDLTKSLTGCDDTILKVTAIDSRGIEKTVSKTVTNFKTYVAPSFASIKVERKDGVDAESNLDFEVNYWNGNFGSLDNEITKIEYQVKQSSSPTWSNWYEIDTSNVTYNDDKASITDVLIHENGTSGGFTVGTQFDIQVKVYDGNSTTILNSTESNVQTLTDGSVAISVNKDSNGEYHIGINGMPDDDYSLKTKNMNVSDNYYVNGVGIVEGGHNVYGFWIKYIDGTMICWREVEFSLNITNAWGSWYYGQNTTQWDFSQEFVEVPKVSLTMRPTSSGSAMLGFYDQPTITTKYIKNIAGIRPTSRSNTPVAVFIYAVGRWK